MGIGNRDWRGFCGKDNIKINNMIETIVIANEIQAVEAGRMLGKVEFSLSDNQMSILHTYAYESGRGIGSLLLKTAMEWAEMNHYTVIPICSFAKSYLDKQAEK